MRKVIGLDNLGCADCAAKMERKIAGLEFVQACRVNFMTGRMTIEAEEQSLPQVIQEAERIIRRIEPHVRLRH